MVWTPVLQLHVRCFQSMAIGLVMRDAGILFLLFSVELLWHYSSFSLLSSHLVFMWHDRTLYELILPLTYSPQLIAIKVSARRNRIANASANTGSVVECPPRLPWSRVLLYNCTTSTYPLILRYMSPPLGSPFRCLWAVSSTATSAFSSCLPYLSKALVV